MLTGSFTGKWFILGGKNLYSETDSSTGLMMWVYTGPSSLEKPTSLASLPNGCVRVCVCVCVCVRVCVCVEGSPGHGVFGRYRWMHVPIRLTERRGARHPLCLIKIKIAHKHAVTVTCKHTKASSEVSCDHATYLHSRFKETVYKAVVGCDPAKWSCGPQTTVRERLHK